jgi:predicted RNA binding protein YcfA (HicA-like mRNA interferase family)
VGNNNLPLASGSDHVKAFERAGWACLKRRGNGKHFILSMDGKGHLSIPDHREVKRTLLKKQIQNAGLTEADYLDCFHKRAKKDQTAPLECATV